MSSQVHRALTVAIAALFLAACSHNANLEKPSAQDNFGVQMARMNLWREAMFRFKRAVEINPQDAQAHNNLAVAYEANGDFERARKEYLEALKLDRSNQYIQKNYSRFVEFLARNKKRQPAKPATTATATPAPQPTPGTGLSGPLAAPGGPAAITPPPPAPQPQPVPPPKPPEGAR